MRKTFSRIFAVFIYTLMLFCKNRFLLSGNGYIRVLILFFMEEIRHEKSACSYGF